MHNNHFFHVSLKLILRNSKGEILLLKMPDESSMADYYDLPGGRISEGKYNIPFQETIKREVKEELGQDVDYSINERPASYSIHSVSSKSGSKELQILMLFFEAEYLGGKIELSDEHKGYDWKMVDEKNVQIFFVRGLFKGMNNYLKFKKDN